MRGIERTVVVLLAFGLAAGLVAGASVASSGPVADAGLDQEVVGGSTVFLDGTGSSDADDLNFEWTVTRPDGRTTTPDCADCERTHFTPSTDGRFEVTLRVTDAGGETAVDTLYVNVAPDPTHDGSEPLRYAGGEPLTEPEYGCDDAWYRERYWASCVNARGPTYPPYTPPEDDEQNDDPWSDVDLGQDGTAVPVREHGL